MQLKDILSAREAERASENPDPTLTPSTETPVEGDPSTSPSDATISPDGTGSIVDTMQTLPMPDQAWPPRPWVPRTNLLRWTRTRTIRTNTAQENMFAALLLEYVRFEQLFYQ